MKNVRILAPRLCPVLPGLAVGFVALALASSSRAGVISVAPAADTRISSLNPDTNFGAGTDFVVGAQGNNVAGAINRALLQFPVAGSIPPGAVIRDATLSVNVWREPFSAVDSSFELHRILTPWEESQATWNISRAGVLWTGPGGVAGTDFAETPSSSQASGLANGPILFSNLGSDVQNWLDHPEQNYGWVMLSGSEDNRFTARRIFSREGSPAPVLQITFDLGLKFNAVSISGDLITLTFNAAANFSYIVQWTDRLIDPDWQELTHFDPNDQDSTLEVSDSTGNGPQRFYRIVQVPPAP